jgi:BirA family biotin operon repressor/biotin-[acetyl-CoA-carboxylase] ligase
MISLDAGAIRGAVREDIAARLFSFEVFPEIESTNSYLMQQEAPPPGQASVALTDNQTMGRGRHGRTWQSPPGSGVCVSVGFTFSTPPANLPALTLAIGLGAIAALEGLGVSGVQLKWPNDLVAGDGKLGGILTETRSHMSGAISIVSGLGINVDLGERPGSGVETDWAYGVSDLAGFVDTLPSRDALAARLIDGLCTTFISYEAGGFEHFVARWADRDWLFGRELTIETPRRRITGIGAGIAGDGALLVDTGAGLVSRITSGSVVMAGSRKANA